MKLFDDFKKFAFKGNVIDMAIGIIIGTAFSAIINSLVANILMPVMGSVTAGIRYDDLKWVLKEAVVNEAGEIITAEVAVAYGLFLQNVIYFLIVAISCFVAVKIINRGIAGAKKETGKFISKIKPKKTVQEPEPEAPKPPTQEELLTEIRDLLKGNNLNSNK